MKTWWAIVIVAVLSGVAVAEPAETSAGSAEGSGAPSGLPAHLVGPKRVELGHRAFIDLPADRILIEKDAAQEMVRKGGGHPDAVVAIVLAPGSSWAIVIEAEDIGYVDDGDAGDLDAKDLLEALKQGTIEQNKTRVQMKIPELFVDDWREPPRYERDKHHLVWGTNLHDSEGKVVNFYTRLLGRDGYIALNLIDSPEMIDVSKRETVSILSAVQFENGARYQDHASGDHDSGIGLKALIVGGAAVAVAKKTGILVGLLLVFKKAFIFIAAAVGGFFKWLTGAKRKKQDAAASMVASEPPPPSDEPPTT